MKMFFDIMQGVSINLFVKNKKKKNGELAQVQHFDLHGLREYKYEQLFEMKVNSIRWSPINYQAPYFFFIPKDFSLEKQYNQNFKLDELMNGISGIETKRDHFAIDFNKETLIKRIKDFVNSDYDPKTRKQKFMLRDNEWSVENAVVLLRENKKWENAYYPCVYRPYDIRWIIYSDIILARDRGSLMASMNKGNLGIIAHRQTKEDFSILASKYVCTHKIVTVYDRSFIFPLFLYPKEIDYQNKIEQTKRIPNLKIQIVNQIAENLKLHFEPEKTTNEKSFTSIDLFDYIYAVLYSPNFREKYKEFLKIDFPRVPYPKDKEIFWQLAKLGGELRQIHLLESPIIDNFITTYPITGSNEVGQIKYTAEKVWINAEQYFDKVPQIAWEFYIGGYQPAQKWLKDRKGRTLTFEDIQHYQKIIIAFTETDRLIKKIDKIKFE